MNRIELSNSRQVLERRGLPPLSIGRAKRRPCWLIQITIAIVFSIRIHASAYDFDAKISESTLRAYLSRAMTIQYLLTSHGDIDDNIRMMTNCGVKFAGRALYQWGREEGGAPAIPHKLEQAKQKAGKIHAADPEIILQACIFEIVSRDVNDLPIPAWVFEDLGKRIEQRNFKYEDMLYENGRHVNQWGQGGSVPDVSRDETKLWFYFLAGSYIDAGCEAIHYGQAELMNGNDPHLDHWLEVLTAARAYAAKHARRHFLLCDAHVPHHGLLRDGKLLFDFHSFPLRIEEVPEDAKTSATEREGERPREPHARRARLRIGYTDAIYGKSKGGFTPSGWSCEHLPYLVEFDNYGRSRKPSESGQGGFWVWGWDEITWFSQQPKEARDEWQRYAWNWVRENDPAGYVEMPGARIISGAVDGKRWYEVNAPSAAMPNGFDQENAIKQIWSSSKR